MKFGAILVEFEGEKDHVHLLVNDAPTTCVSKLVNSLKESLQELLEKRTIWQLRIIFGAMLFGLLAILRDPVEALRFLSLKQYIEQQNSPKS